MYIRVGTVYLHEGRESKRKTLEDVISLFRTFKVKFVVIYRIPVPCRKTTNNRASPLLLHLLRRHIIIFFRVRKSFYIHLHVGTTGM